MWKKKKKYIYIYKGTTKCDKITIICDGGTAQCDNRIVKCDKK